MHNSLEITRVTRPIKKGELWTMRCAKRESNRCILFSLGKNVMDGEMYRGFLTGRKPNSHSIESLRALNEDKRAQETLVIRIGIFPASLLIRVDHSKMESSLTPQINTIVAHTTFIIAFTLSNYSHRKKDSTSTFITK